MLCLIVYARAHAGHAAAHPKPPCTAVPCQSAAFDATVYLRVLCVVAAAAADAQVTATGEQRCAVGEQLQKLPHGALASVWWPFTQHQTMSAQNTLTIDARAGETLLTGMP